jgi:hypothetical protein
MMAWLSRVVTFVKKIIEELREMIPKDSGHGKIFHIRQAHLGETFTYNA